MSTIEQMPGLGYEGIRSFCRLPLCFDINALKADVAVIGVALDTGTTNRGGTRYGPQAIREGSMIYSMGFAESGELYDVDLRKHILKETRIVDCGDIPTPPTLMTECFDLITGSIDAILKKEAMPVVLGGDHSISFPVVRAFRDTPIHVVHFDAHLDMMDDEFGMKYTHGNPLKRISELDHVKGITQIGIRGLLNGGEFEACKQSGDTTIITADEVFDRGLEWVASQVPETNHLYVTLDIDCLDPKEAPGTGTPEFGGLEYRQLSRLIRLIVPKGKLVGLDLVEVNPLFDPTGRTGQLAARLILDTLATSLG